MGGINDLTRDKFIKTLDRRISNDVTDTGYRRLLQVLVSDSCGDGEYATDPWTTVARRQPDSVRLLVSIRQWEHCSVKFPRTRKMSTLCHINTGSKCAKGHMASASANTGGFLGLLV